MLDWVMTLYVAGIGWILGYGSVTGTVAEHAEEIFWIAVVLLFASVVAVISRKRLPMD